MSATSSRSSTSPAVVIGRLGRPHGVGGTLHARPTGATLAQLPVGSELQLRCREGGERRLALASCSGSGDRLRLTLTGITDRDSAAPLTGAVIAVAADLVVAPRDPDTWLVSDLVGCRVVSEGGSLGVVREVHSLPANDVLELEREGEEALLLPFTADAIAAVNIADRTIELRPGLLD